MDVNGGRIFFFCCCCPSECCNCAGLYHLEQGLLGILILFRLTLF